ncbi:MAG: lipid-A-disaccharide synthase, partial [Planctomycetota bacterium]
MREARIYLSAGEASGDLHAAHLVEALRRLRPGWRFAGLGGERMAEAGVELRANLVDHAVMGLRRVFGQIGALLRITAIFLEEMRRAPPDLLLLIDNPGLHLNLARLARARGIPVVYYICPQVWAWAPWRLRRVARRADLLLAILPFEEGIYSGVHPRVRYVGNPVFDHLAAVERRLEAEQPSPGDGDGGGEPILALFPGSRRQEVEEALPAMLDAARGLVARRPGLRVRVSCQRPSMRPLVEEHLGDAGVEASIVEGPPHALQRAAYLSLVVSGTATLEQAFFGVPMAVVYPVRPLARRLFGTLGVTPHISLVNLFAGREVVPEILFAPGEERRIEEAAIPLLEDEGSRQGVIDDLRRLREERF